LPIADCRLPIEAISDQRSGISDQESELFMNTQHENPVWERLRESMERLESSRQRAVDPAALALKLANRAKLLRGRAAVKSGQPTTGYLTFSSGHERFGVLISDVVEIQALDHYSPVPRTPPFIVGAIPWRGMILTLIDLGRLFGIQEAGIADFHVCVIVESCGRRVAFVAREVEDLLDIPADQIKLSPELPGHAPAEWVAGVHDGNRLLLCLERLLQDDKFVNWKNG
jgi:purine-binding chemotaxis protein CheW